MVITSPRAQNADRGFPVPPDFWDADLDDLKNYIRVLAEAIRLLYDGKINATGTVTFTANQTTTVVQDRRCGPATRVIMVPTTENAGGEVGWWISNVGELSSNVPSFTVNHANDARTDRTFWYALLG